MRLQILFLYLCKKTGMINRIIKGSILSDYKRRKVIVLLGARQVGKTTLLSELCEGKDRVLSLNCDNVDDVLALEGKTTTELRQLLSSYELVFIDEAQRGEECRADIENDWGFEVGNTSGCYRFFIARYGRRDKRAGDWATYRVQPVPILAAGTRFVQFGKGGKQIVGKPDDLWALSGRS